MNWSAFLSGLLGTAIPAFIGSLVMLQLKKKIDTAQERLKSDLQQEIVKFTNWHEKRISALEVIYHAFRVYLSFLRERLYFDSKIALDPMHEFRDTLDAQMLYIDDAMARKLSQYQSELLLFHNSAVSKLASDGEVAREKIRHDLDYKIPAYLLRLQEDINQALDPNHSVSKEVFRALMINWMESRKPDA